MAEDASKPEQPLDDAAAEALRAAREAMADLGNLDELSDASANAPRESGRHEPRPMAMPDLGGTTVKPVAGALDLLSDVNLNVKIELGRTRMLVEDVLKLGEGAVVELDKLAGDPVDVYVNERHVARGEVLVLNDNFCVRINEILTPPADGAAAKSA